MSTQEWPTYLLWQVPPDLRVALVEQAEEQESSLADVVRPILCEEMGLDCQQPRPQRITEARRRDTENGNYLIRLQPELFSALRARAAAEDTSVRALVLSILAAHYQEVLT